MLPREMKAKILQRLREFERKYGYSSDTFYDLVQEGEIEVEGVPELEEWYRLVSLYLNAAEG